MVCRRISSPEFPLLLACLEMRLTHPVSGEPLTLRAPLAADFSDVLGKLGWGAVRIP